MPPAPGVFQYHDSVSTAAWKVLSVDSEETSGENGRADNAVDGNIDTIWHTEWSKKRAEYPHEIVIDLGGATRARGLRLLPRQGGTQNGLPKQLAVYLSSERNTWHDPVFVGESSNDWQPKSLLFEKVAEGRYLRIVFKSGMSSDPYLALAEIGLIQAQDAAKSTDWQSQYNVAWVEVGGDRFDVQGAALEEVKKIELASLAGKSWQRVTLPHSTNDELLGSDDPWRGVCYYRKTVEPNPSWVGKRTLLTFGAAMQVSDVWIGKKHVGGRRGGYLPIVIDTTPYTKTGQPLEVLVRLNNEDNPLVPPGKPYKQLDFTYVGGLYRDATLTVTDPIHITDPILANKARSGGVAVSFRDVSDQTATVEAKTYIRNDREQPAAVVVEQILVSQSGAEVAVDRTEVPLEPSGDRQAVQRLVVHEPRLWSPDDPNLYVLKTTLKVEGKVVDHVETKVGIRHIGFTRKDGLLVNGKSLRLVGTNRHQEYPWVGNALSKNAQYRDFYKIKQAGFNVVRLSHYPQDPAVYDACDELGIFVIDCIPGWQFMNKDPRFVAQVEQDIRDMIRRDRNHPCVLFWETSLNETYPPAAIANRWHEVAHEEFPGSNFFTAGDALTGANWDLPYNSWTEEDKSRPQSAVPSKPGYIREYGDYEFGGGASTSRMFRGQGEDALLQAAWNFIWSHNRNRSQYPWTIGDGTWVMYDYNRGYDPRPESSGMSDINRIPRFTYFFYRSQLDPNAPGSNPMVYVANWWTPRPSPCKVVVFSNCDEVELRLNGKVIARQKPDSGPDTLYGDYIRGGKPFDGGNSRHLGHPPFTFFGVPYEPGELTAVGLIGNRPVAEHRARTPGKAVSLRLRVDISGRPLSADGGDLMFVYAEAVDEKGTVVPDFSGEVKFSIAGEGTIAGPSNPKAEAGIATILLRAGSKPSRIQISAQSKGLRSGEVKVNSN
ncbi:MAG: DUF4982 domain-containing protein [Armatimonadetes bacterium]|nr:DUF4982 domain-containing protein [Armatimonadota bacterium]